jgi:hypothetical protein
VSVASKPSFGAAKRYKFVCVTDPNANRLTIRGMELYVAFEIPPITTIEGAPKVMAAVTADAGEVLIESPRPG